MTHRPTTRRRTLLAMSAAGLALGGLGITGVFAAATSQASSAGNRYTTGEFVEREDLELQIAAADTTGAEPSCDGELAWDTVTQSPLISFTEGPYDPEDPGTPGDYQQITPFCLRNVGSQTGDLSVRAQDVLDLDVACTGREIESDPDSCGDGAAGELSDHLAVNFQPCGGAPEATGVLADYEESAQALGTLVQDQVICLEVDANTISLFGEDLRLAQSDSVTWTFLFDLTTLVP